MHKLTLSLLLVALSITPVFGQEITKGRALKVQLDIIAKGSEKEWKNCLIKDFRKLSYVKLVNKDPDYQISVFSILITKSPSNEALGYSVYSSVLKPVPDKYIVNLVADEYSKKVKRLVENSHQILSQKIVFNLPENLPEMCRDIVDQFKEVITRAQSQKRKKQPAKAPMYGN